jgi:polysaccharide deacetylase 2 family uncharacterized protein YibQ
LTTPKRGTPRRRGRRGGGRQRLLLVLLAAAATFAAGIYLGGRRTPGTAPASAAVHAAVERAGEREAPKRRRDERGARPQRAGSGTAAPAPELLELRPVEDGARVALVIDDLGRSLADLDTLAALGVPVTYAVLPYETMTAEVVERLREREAEVLLHLPMDPTSDANPGPGALHAGMEAGALREATARALEAVPGAVGVNNHMGSELSAEPRAMRAVFDVLAERQLFWLDSRTTAASVGYQLALEQGIPAAERQVFLDTDPRFEAVVAELRRLFDLARTRGAAVGIGHPHPATLRALAQEVPAARAAGYEFVPVSFLLDRPSDLPE